MIALDLSRLLSRAGRVAPTGIDRVELAYARHFSGGERPVCFVARTGFGRLGLLPADGAAQFLALLSALWRGGGAGIEAADGRLDALAGRLCRAGRTGGERRLRERLSGSARPPVYLAVSHLPLEHAGAIVRLKARCGARFVCMIHDLIPLELPHCTRPSQTRRHRRRVAVAATLADAVIVNSRATGAALRGRLDKAGRLPRIVVALPGLDLAAGDVHTAAEGEEYFVCLGTIEPRKNHRLLFEVWRRLVAARGERAPRLLLIGQRGWQGGRIMAEVAQSAALRSSVEEHSGLSDAAVAPLLRGARALLMPSFAEGFGLPVVEALAAGVPVLCSDLPALRECAGTAAEFLDPDDADGWFAAVVACAEAASPRRQSLVARLPGWRPPRWPDHFAVVERLLADLT